MGNIDRPGVAVTIRPVRAGDEVDWLRMRTLLWPEGAGDHQEEIQTHLVNGSFTWSEWLLALAVFVAERQVGGLCGLLEASVRPYAEGCITGPVGYIEGWFVDADVRRLGVGGALIRAAERWAIGQGCREIASDAHPANGISLSAHSAVGFEEVGRAVHLRKRLFDATAPEGQQP
jgi:aminoglycoside 6'-N-acetyltransferase I